MRVANRHGPLRLKDIASVANWVPLSGTIIRPAHRWASLVERAQNHDARERVRLAAAKHAPWHFFCASTAWRGYQVDPITDVVGLWLEGQRHGNCLYRVRYECDSYKPSRFFRVSRAGRSIASLELAWRAPQAGFSGMDRVWGRWELQDLRLSYNRLPDTALLESMQAFAAMYNTWAKRLRRQPPGHVQDTQERIAALERLARWNPFT